MSSRFVITNPSSQVSGSRVQGVSLSFHQSVKEKCYIDPVGVTHLHAKKRKSRMKRVIKLPTVSSKMADIPANEYSLRKYGKKPIKVSPYPRALIRRAQAVLQPNMGVSINLKV